MEALCRIFHNRADMRRCQRLKVDLRTTRAQGGIDVIRLACRCSDEHEVRRRALLKEFAYVRRDTLIIGVIVCGFKVGALVLKYLEQLVLEHLIHLTDLVNEEDASVRIGHQPRFWLGNAAVGKVLLRALIDGVMHRAEQRVRHVARIPTQRCSVRLDKGCSLCKRRYRTFLRRLENEACRCRLADAGRPIEQ